MTKKSKADARACSSSKPAATRYSVSFSGDARKIWTAMRSHFPNMTDSERLKKLAEGASDPWDRALHEFSFMETILLDVLDDEGKECVDLVRALLMKLRYKRHSTREVRDALSGAVERLEGVPMPPTGDEEDD